MKQWMMVWITVALSCACSGMHNMTPVTPPGTMGQDQIDSSVSDSRRQQEQRLWQFDEALKPQQPDCDLLCEYHTQICNLATTICKLSDQDPSHHRAKNACEQANETCRQTNQRLPEECWCTR